MRRIARKTKDGRRAPALRVGLVALIGPALMACAELRVPDLAADPAPGPDEPGTGSPAATAPPGIDYAVTITGVPEKDLTELLEQSSQLAALRDRPPATLAGLRRRADDDRERLASTLRSEGYYAAEVRVEIDRATTPIKVTLYASTGIRYLLADYEVRYEIAPVPEADAQPSLEDLGLYIGMPARAPAIVAAQRALLDTLARRGYPLAQVRDRTTVVDHPTTTMAVTLAVDAGPFARFGPLRIEGLDAVEDDYVRGLLDWREGETYNKDKVERARQALAGTGLFENVQIAPGEAVGPDHGLPIALTVTEAKHRSIGFGASFSTSEGLGGEVFWEHRNLLGRNERLRLGLTVAEIEQVLDARFGKPGFLRPDQVLQVDGALTNRDTEAFSEQSFSGALGVERQWAENLRLSAGLSGEYSILKDEAGEETFRLIGLPLGSAYDTTDSILDPTRGARLNLALTPYTGGGDDGLFFTAATVAGSSYYAVDSDARFVLAGRAKVGTIVGEETEAVPANKRFYAGGGGSIRGFEFQSVGPLDDENDPLGGRSILEVNAEMRIRISDTIGIVPFIDGGSVFDSSYPDFDEQILWAAGVGARYFSAIGPLRVDIATPLNKRDLDDSFQFYISLGQAF